MDSISTNKIEVTESNPAKDIRSAITYLVGARLDAQKALKQLKDNKVVKPVEYELPVELLEDAIERFYELENRLGEIHQSTIVSIATEIVSTCGMVL